MKTTLQAMLGLLAALLGFCAGAQEAAYESAIRKSIQDSQPQWPAVDEVNKTPLPGLYEVRIGGTQIFYSDEKGQYLIEGGNLIDLRQKRNLTQERMNKLLAVEFSSLPLKDSFTVVRGNGKRKLAIFSDPNCGYCKRIERDFTKLDNVTIHVFLYPVLGSNSIEKSQAIWCAKDRSKVWLDWMLREQSPSSANCDAEALQRNLAFGHKHKIQGTPTLFFADGSRVPGALDASQLEKMLAATTSSAR